MTDNIKRIVIKLGSSVILKENGEPNSACLKALVQEMAELRRNKELIIVTSGAIGIGKTLLGVSRPKDLSEKQALAAVGQAHLIQIYENLFSQYGIKVGQVLLTREDLQGRHRYLNARNTFLSLLEHGVVPVINENDTVAVDEIKFGDNDTLSAIVASKMDADLLVILSDIEGVYRDPDKREKGVIREVVDDVANIEESATGSSGKSRFGTGGITTKIEAAKIMMSSGVPMVVARGDHPHILARIITEFSGAKTTGTWFISSKKMASRKRWIAFNAEIKGSVTIDEGAAKALKEDGKSLLPSGIKDVQGSFEQGDAVSVKDSAGREIAKGVVNYAADEVKKIAGKKTADIEQALGRKDYDEVIHRDNLVIL